MGEIQEAKGSGTVLVNSECSKIERESNNILLLEAFQNYQLHLAVLLFFCLGKGTSKKQTVSLGSYKKGG